MPSFAEAGTTFDYVLEGDRGQESPVTFELQVLSKRDARKIKELRLRYIGEVNQLAKDDTLSEMLFVVKGWRNAKQPFSQEALEGLTELSCWELVNAATTGAVLSAEERKKFVLPVNSETD